MQLTSRSKTACPVSSERLLLSPATVGATKPPSHRCLVAVRRLLPTWSWILGGPTSTWLVGWEYKRSNPHLYSQPASKMKLLAGLQLQMGLAPSPASRMVIGLVLLISSLDPAHACMTRSGQDGERVVSHQGEEPEYHPQVGSKSFQI